MILQTITAVLIILAMLAGWIGVQFLARSFAARHPEFGPAREDGEGCGGLLCLCKNQDTCPKMLFKKATLKPKKVNESQPLNREL